MYNKQNYPINSYNPAFDALSSDLAKQGGDNSNISNTKESTTNSSHPITLKSSTDVETFADTLAKDHNWETPTPNLVKEMVELLDKYFSDDNLMRDKFLLKHVRRNKAGYVSVKLLTSFKKLKYLSKTDWRVTAYAISKSENLELNEAGTKVRRKLPIPDINMPTTSIKMLLIKLPDSLANQLQDNGTKEYGIENISPKLSGFGRLNSAKIVRPGEGLPNELRNHTTKHLELGTRHCAVVEFEKTEDCQIAYRVLSRNIRALKMAKDPNRNIAIETSELKRYDQSLRNSNSTTNCVATEATGDYNSMNKNGVNGINGIPGNGHISHDKEMETLEAPTYTDEDLHDQEHEVDHNSDSDLDGEDDHIEDEHGRKIHMKLALPETITLEDIEGWQVSLLGSGRNPRRNTGKPQPQGVVRMGKLTNVGMNSPNRIRQNSESSAYSSNIGGYVPSHSGFGHWGLAGEYFV